MWEGCGTRKKNKSITYTSFFNPSSPSTMISVRMISGAADIMISFFLLEQGGHSGRPAGGAGFRRGAGNQPSGDSRHCLLQAAVGREAWAAASRSGGALSTADSTAMA